MLEEAREEKLQRFYLGGTSRVTVSGVDYPTGWELSVYGGNPNDLVITHNLNKRTANLTLFSVAGGVESQKLGTAAYTELVGESLNQTRIAGLSQYPAPLVLHLMFS